MNDLQHWTGHDASLIRNMFIYTECDECGCEWNAKCIVQNNIWIDTIFIDNTNIREIVPASEQPWMIDELNQNAEKCKLYNHLMRLETS